MPRPGAGQPVAIRQPGTRIFQWVRAWSSPVLTGRIWPLVRGSGWRRCRARARRGGGSTRWPAWSRSRSARLPRPGTTGSPRSGSGSGGLARADLARLRAPWDPLAGRYRAPDEKTIRVVLDRVDPRALARAGPARRPGSWLAAGGQRARLPRPADRPAGESAGPRPVKDRGRGRQDLSMRSTVAEEGCWPFFLPVALVRQGEPAGAAQEGIGQSLASTCRKSFSLTRGSFHGGVSSARPYATTRETRFARFGIWRPGCFTGPHL